MGAEGFTSSLPPEPTDAEKKTTAVPAGAAVDHSALRIRLATKTHRDEREQAMLTTVNSTPIVKFCASVELSQRLTDPRWYQLSPEIMLS